MVKVDILYNTYKDNQWLAQVSYKGVVVHVPFPTKPTRKQINNIVKFLKWGAVDYKGWGCTYSQWVNSRRK